MKRQQRSIARGIGLGLCAAWLAGAVPARADATAAEKAAAEALFDGALDLMKQGRHAEACPRLEQSQRIDPGIGTLLYLAECYEKTGRTASAWATFRQAMSESRAAGQTERARKAQARATQLEPSLPKLKVEVAAEDKVEGLSVRVAGKAVDSALLGIAIPVDPGDIAIEASAPGHESWTTTVKVRGGAEETVTVPPLKRTASPPPALTEAPPTGAAAPPPAGAEERPGPAPGSDKPAGSGMNPLRVAGLVAGGVGVVGIGLGSFFGVKAITKNSDAEVYCPRGDTCDDRRGVTLTEEAKSAATVSNIAIGVGAAALAGGVVLYIVGTRAPSQESRVQVAPLLDARNVGLRVGGTFE
ncbi:hypothetical protein SOCE26_102590 [Sorangium cellulosum]|uniref:PEGA domain-containing protein n=1 Tax=Sorangium cellulosum TaxID=56 RepID=A0A2L0FAT7_SORCE|nr:tetratricopeptide repeat protein [Sorangium cellulosum]AUX48718.1 hypothetical protein SOCE26_102590 [Sorangium cellulosum]